MAYGLDERHDPPVSYEAAFTSEEDSRRAFKACVTAHMDEVAAWGADDSVPDGSSLVIEADVDGLEAHGMATDPKTGATLPTKGSHVAVELERDRSVKGGCVAVECYPVLSLGDVDTDAAVALLAAQQSTDAYVGLQDAAARARALAPLVESLCGRSQDTVCSLTLKAAEQALLGGTVTVRDGRVALVGDDGSPVVDPADAAKVAPIVDERINPEAIGSLSPFWRRAMSAAVAIDGSEAKGAAVFDAAHIWASRDVLEALCAQLDAMAPVRGAGLAGSLPRPWPNGPLGVMVVMPEALTGPDGAKALRNPVAVPIGDLAPVEEEGGGHGLLL